MKVYLLTLLNSNFEEWHEKFPDKDINEFPFSVDKMSVSGALFDKESFITSVRMSFPSYQRMIYMNSFTTGH